MHFSEKDFRNLYDRETLEYWQGRYPANVEWNFTNLLMEKLLPRERQGARNATVVFPLVPSDQFCNIPFAFYTSITPPVITIPILSIKFLDDLSIAAAWLDVNGYSLESMVDYISMLKYADAGRFPGSRYPRPLTALHIPDNALENQLVDDVSQKMLKSALIWILAHELGHIVHQHPGYDGISPAQAQEHEIEADRFATEMFRRIGTAPAGMTILLTMFVHFLPHAGDFATEGEWWAFVSSRATHPVSTARLRTLAEDLLAAPDGFAGAEPNQAAARQTVINIAEETMRIATILKEPSMHRFIRAHGIAASPEALKPRRLGEILVTGMTSGAAASDQPFDGVYHGKHIRNLSKGGTESLDATLVIKRKKNSVAGRFSFGLGEGKVNGRLIKDELRFEWSLGDLNGKGVLKSESPHDFSGTWGYNDSMDDGGRWTGVKDDRVV